MMREGSAVFSALSEVLSAQPDGRWRAVPERLPRLEEALIELADSPVLLDAIVFVTAIAERLLAEHDSPEAASALIVTVGRARPRLGLLDSADQLVRSS